MGFDHDNVLEVKLSMGTALSQSENFRSMLLKYSEIKEVAFCQIPFVTDMIRPLIGYNYNGRHSYMSWTGVSSQLPELLNNKNITMDVGSMLQTSWYGKHASSMHY
jgi:hypothetical protein